MLDPHSGPGPYCAKKVSREIPQDIDLASRMQVEGSVSLSSMVKAGSTRWAELGGAVRVERAVYTLHVIPTAHANVRRVWRAPHEVKADTGSHSDGGYNSHSGQNSASQRPKALSQRAGLKLPLEVYTAVRLRAAPHQQ